MSVNIKINVLLCDFMEVVKSLFLFLYKEAIHDSLTFPAPDISQSEAGGEHSQEKVGQSDERVKDPR